ncbi:MAG: DUF5665 domain-containing protein [Pseudomonadota bacterium]|nr:DUF5665 domain-containing protein [Pseudomonadota bacterium]
MKFRRTKKQIKTFAEMTPEERQTQIDKLAYLFERMRLGDYVNNFNRPWRVFYMNMLGGVGKGVGLTIGVILFIAICVKVCITVVKHVPAFRKPFEQIIEYAQMTEIGQIIIESEETGKPIKVIMEERKAEKNGTAKH